MVVAKGFNTLCLVFCLSNFYPLAKSIPCKGSATYKLSFQGEWSEKSSRPNGAKFSGLIGCSHNICYQMWESGEKASLGVKNVAEKGDYDELKDNILKLSRNKTTWQPFYQVRGENIEPVGITKLQHNVRVDALRPMVSVIARIDPSPDWFVGISSIDLCDRKTGEWMLEKKVFPLLPYDAGARSGNTFSTTGSPTNEDISRVDEGIFSDWYNTRDILGLFHFSRHQVSQSSVVGETENDETFQCPSMASRHVWSSFISVIAALLLVKELF